MCVCVRACVRACVPHPHPATGCFELWGLGTLLSPLSIRHEKSDRSRAKSTPPIPQLFLGCGVRQLLWQIKRFEWPCVAPLSRNKSGIWLEFENESPRECGLAILTLSFKHARTHTLSFSDAQTHSKQGARVHARLPRSPHRRRRQGTLRERVACV